MRLQIACQTCGLQKEVEISANTLEEGISKVQNVINEGILTHRCSGTYRVINEPYRTSDNRQNSENSVRIGTRSLPDQNATKDDEKRATEITGSIKNITKGIK